MARIELPPNLRENYRVEEKIGEGGMGAIFKAHHIQLDRPVAIKVLSKTSFDVLESIERFKDEALVCAKLQHRNVVRLYDYDLSAAPPFMAFELVNGPPLKDVMDDLLDQPLAKRLSLMASICDGLQEAHGQGIVHRDLKPENILIDADGTPKVADFGLAKLGGVTSFKTRTGVVVGTPQYMSPEQAQAQEPCPQSDVYALGVLIFEMATGSVPFDGKNDLGILLQHVQDQPPLITDIIPNLDEDLAELVDRCLEKRKEDRPQRASEVARSLRRIVRSLAGKKKQSRGKAKRSRALREQKRSGIDTTKNISRLENPSFEKFRRPLWLGLTLAIPALAFLYLFFFQSVPPPSIIEKLKVQHTGSRSAILSWRGSWTSDDFKATLRRNRSSDGETIKLKLLQRKEPGVGSRCPYSFVARLDGLTPQTKYKLSLHKQDGTTTLSMPLNTLKQLDFTPNTRISLGDAGQVDVIIEARTPFTGKFTPENKRSKRDSTFNRRLKSQYGLHSLVDNRVITCVATSIDGDEKTIEINIVDELKKIAREAKDAFWQSRQSATVLKCLSREFFRPWERKLFARSEAKKLKMRKEAGPFWKIMNDRLGLLPWFKKLEPIVNGAGALLASPLLDEELRQLMAQALLPLELTARTVRYRNLPVPPQWERAVSATRRPYPLRFNRSWLRNKFEELKCTDTGLIPSPFYCLMDGKHHVLPQLYPDPDLGAEVTRRRLTVNLTADQLNKCREAELSLSFRLVRIQIMVIVELNGRSFVASFAARNQELREYRKIAIELNTDYRISEMLLAAGKPTDVESAEKSIDPLDEVLPPANWTMYHQLPKEYLREGKNEILLYPMQSRIEGLETVAVSVLNLSLGL